VVEYLLDTIIKKS